MVVDTDVHHGNGTAAILLTIPPSSPSPSISGTITPPTSLASTLDLDMDDGATDNQYLIALLPAVREALDKFHPEMLFYVGGADPYRDDQLGGLGLTINGLQSRDQSVFEEARKRKIPVVTTLAGGYARQLADTIQIHVNTIVAAKEVAEKFPQALPAGN